MSGESNPVVHGLSAGLVIDEAAEVSKICDRIREALSRHLHRRGLVVAISGGIDSAVCSALAVQAIGRERVFGLLLPERDSSSESTIRGRQVVEHLGIEHALFDISPALEAVDCYRWRDDAIRNVFPRFGPGWRNKIAIAGGQARGLNFFKLIVQSPEGEVSEARLPVREYLQIVAATNFKQRVRKMIEYFHADRLNYAVVGTPNRLEYDQGFLVKNGDGSADIKPIAHLYKTQVYDLARFLGLPGAICEAQPTTDTYSMVQGQDEFYFVLPYAKMDVALLAYNSGVTTQALAAELGVSCQNAAWIYRDIERKRATTAMLHWSALLVERPPGPHTTPPALW